jgi:hypothetical protein
MIIVLFDEAEKLITETHFLCAFSLTSRIRIAPRLRFFLTNNISRSRPTRRYISVTSPSTFHTPSANER